MDHNPDQPLAVSYGMGVDSTAVLVGLAQRRIRPDLIFFADVGGEKTVTYEYLPIIQDWLQRQAFPPIEVVTYVPSRFKNWPPYYSLEENCLTNGTLPSISFGFASCSQKWKQSPQHKNMIASEVAQVAWSQGKKVTKAIGYDCSTRDTQRRTYSDKLIEDDPLYDYWYPLQTWGWDRDDCKREIVAAGLPVPEKSSCFFCLAMKEHEVDALPADKLRRIVLLEARAKPRLTVVEGLWRKSTKTKPGSMTQYILNKGLLPPEEIERIQKVPLELVRFQDAFAKGEIDQPLWEFLRQNFPEMYGNQERLVQIAPAQPTLFG